MTLLIESENNPSWPQFEHKGGKRDISCCPFLLHMGTCFDCVRVWVCESVCVCSVRERVRDWVYYVCICVWERKSVLDKGEEREIERECVCAVSLRFCLQSFLFGREMKIHPSAMLSGPIQAVVFFLLKSFE